MNKILFIVLYSLMLPGLLVITVAVSLLCFCYKDRIEQIIEHIKKRDQLAHDMVMERREEADMEKMAVEGTVMERRGTGGP